MTPEQIESERIEQEAELRALRERVCDLIEVRK